MDDAMTGPEDTRPWVREYITLGAVQGDFRSPSALAVVERMRHPEDVDAVAYMVRQVEDLPADTPIQTATRYAARLADVSGAARCVLDASVAGAPMLRVWSSAIASPRALHAVRIGDREPAELSGTARFTLTPVARLDLLGAIRVALDRPGGLVFGERATAAQAALEAYVASRPSVAPGEAEWEPTPTWHLVLALGLAVWHLMESPAELVRAETRGPDADWQSSDRARYDRRWVRDETPPDHIPDGGTGAPSPIPSLGAVMAEAAQRPKTQALTPSGKREFVRLT